MARWSAYDLSTSPQSAVKPLQISPWPRSRRRCQTHSRALSSLSQTGLAGHLAGQPAGIAQGQMERGQYQGTFLVGLHRVLVAAPDRVHPVLDLPFRALRQEKTVHHALQVGRRVKKPGVTQHGGRIADPNLGIGRAGGKAEEFPLKADLIVAENLAQQVLLAVEPIAAALITGRQPLVFKIRSYERQQAQLDKTGAPVFVPAPEFPLADQVPFQPVRTGIEAEVDRDRETCRRPRS